MKKFLAIILLISHINSSMFFPAMEEDEINSMVEYVDEQVLNHQDVTPDDTEDEDKQNNFLLNKISITICCPVEVIDTSSTYQVLPQLIFSEFKMQKVPQVLVEILSPPPEALS